MKIEKTKVTSYSLTITLDEREKQFLEDLFGSGTSSVIDEITEFSHDDTVVTHVLSSFYKALNEYS